MAHKILLYLGTFLDKDYAPRLKPIVGTATVFTVFQDPQTLTELEVYCAKRNITGVFTSSVGLLIRLIASTGKSIESKRKPSIDNYQGSYFKYKGLEIIIVPPLKQLVTVPYAPFLFRRYISKLTAPEGWRKLPAFEYTLLTTRNHEDIFNQFSSATLIAVDIETLKEDLQIRCIGYTAVFISDSSIHTRSVVLPIDSMFAVSVMRKFNWELKAPKVFQNGKYDLAYLSRYNAVPFNYLLDTANMFHCWYSELPKDLGTLAAFFIRESMYWKDLADTNDLSEYYRYNALDTFATAFVAIEWIMEAPDWAKRNYTQEFPLVFPCHLSEMIGLKRDMEVLTEAATEYEEKITAATVKLSKMVGTYPALFNTNSTPQNAALRTVLGCKDLDSSDEKSLKKMASRHPINSKICNTILDIRGDRKLISTYLKVGENGSEFNGRILYSLNPHGTDTGRLASREHHFWCGLQIQNIPRGKEVKQTLIADPEFRFAECDLKQAETRDTAYVSGDAALIRAINSDRDFHSLNASAFFGVPYDSIFDDATGKALDKALRDLSKRVNHGANYLMGVGVLIDTMGEDKVWEAKRLLKLPKFYGLRGVAEYLLAAFHATYPTLSELYYPAVVNEVVTTKKLVSHTSIRKPAVYGITPVYSPQVTWELEPLEGWTRYCFGDPLKNKLDKNAYVAHVSQSLNAMALNVAYLRVFYEIAMNPKYSDHFKLCAQIHDSIFFQFRVGHEYLIDMVRERMEVPIRIKSYDGKVRVFTVPADNKAGKDGKGALRWSETE